MSKLTETDILIAYDPYLTDLVQRYAPRIPFSDAFAEAQQELLLCIRCYRAAYHGKFWSDYARPKICDCLKALQKAQNGRQHRERVHLDAQLKEDSTETFGKLLLVEQAKVTRVELFELISHAPKTAREIGWMIVQKYTQPEIEEALHVSDGEYRHALGQLGAAWEEYNKDTL